MLLQSSMLQGERRAKKDKAGLPYEIGFARANDFPALWDAVRFPSLQ